MLNRNAAVSSLTICAVAIAGACADAPPTEPHSAELSVSSLFGGSAPDPQSYDGTLDAHFVRITQQVPGFGGFFYDEAGVLTVYMTADAPVAPLRTLLGADEFNVLTGRYDFVELDRIHQRIAPVLGIHGVVFTDADEAANRVRVGVENPTAAADVEHALGMLGVPREAVTITPAEPVRFAQSLGSFVRPVAGGLQISFVRDIQVFVCGIAYNVRSQQVPGVHGFIFPDHCRDPRIGVITSYWQPSPAIPNSFIGTEAHSTPYFTGGICPPGRQCRWSDSAGGRYAPGVSNAFASIYRPIPGTTLIDPVNPTFSITSERPFPLVGDVMHKVGRVTGWTSGPVIASCSNVNVSGTDITFLCQERVQAVASGGDSGAPVFDFFPANQLNEVRVAGMLWGTSVDEFIFSAINEIRRDNIAPPGRTWSVCHPDHPNCCDTPPLGCPWGPRP